jgi:hypothetical protein
MTQLKFIAVSVMAVVSLSVAKLSSEGPFHPGEIAMHDQHNTKKRDLKQDAGKKMARPKSRKTQQLPIPANRRQLLSPSPDKRKVPPTTMD